MKKAGLILLSAIVVLSSCKKKKINDMKDELKENYAELVLANYTDALTTAQTLQSKIDAFVATPTAQSFADAKQAWLDVREPYGQTEAFRFANGPIDAADGPEGLLNAWPLDEAYIDYVDGNANAGIVNNLSYTIDVATLEELNEQGGESNISVGYHAIEFLLWGQDDSNTGLLTPGTRPYTDFVTGGSGTQSNQDRRGQYLKVCAQLIVTNLQSMVDEWSTNGAYRTVFMDMDSDEAVTNILTAIGVLSKSELAGERMFVALDNQNQEDEHSCFSDNTHRDIILNAKGIINVYKGSYTKTNGTSVSGRSIADIVRELDEELADEIDALIASTEASVNAIPVPFNNALTQETTGGNGPIMTAINNLQDLGDKFAEAAEAMDLSISTDLPE